MLSNRPGTKRLIVAICLFPVTLPFVVLKSLVEWWHFRVSNRAVSLLRRTDKRLMDFFDSLDGQSS